MKILRYIVMSVLAVSFFSCSGDDEFSSSIFDVEDHLNESSTSYEFDMWLRKEYVKPYNLDFRYKMEDVGSDLSYNLVPASFERSKEMAVLIKYLWFDVYSEVVGPDFLKDYGPRIIHLIGSPAYNPISGTIILGTAEGGIKVTLYRCNELDPTDVDMLNEYYFKTMHHEFAHILHQKKLYPVEFGLISQGHYNPLGWQYKTDSEAASLGFVSPYAGSQVREDFVEIIANYLVKSDKQWQDILDMASDPEDEDGGNTLPDDGIDGKAVILQKLEIAKKWLKDSWNIDLDALRAEIIKREATIDEIL